MNVVAEDDIEVIKRKLRSYKREEVIFNEPHFTYMLLLRQGDKEEVINHILNPEKLVYSYSEVGKYGDIKHNLHYEISNTKTMRLPVIFNTNSKRNIYILTYIMTYRNWRNLLKKG